MNTINFSFALIARNESKTLPRLLESLNEFKTRGGKVFICDTGSTDNTAQIARDWGCEVFEVGDIFRKTITEEQAKEINDRFIVDDEEPVVKGDDTLFDFASARNFIAEKADTKMVSMPDCDEIYTKLDIDKIIEVINNGAEQCEYNFVFSHDEHGNEAIKFRHCKFYDKTKLKWFGIIHEILTGNANRVFLEEDIIKLEHYQNHETNRGGYLKGLALDCYENIDNDRNSHYFGRELLWTNRPKSAIKEFTRHIAMNRWQAEKAQSMIYIGDSYIKLGEDDIALDYYHKAFLTEPQRREPLIRLAEYFYKRNDQFKTNIYATACLEIPNTSFYANQQSHYTFYPHEMLSWAKYHLGDRLGAKYHFDKSREYLPYNSKYLHDYRFYNELPTVSFVIPHLALGNKREEGLNRCLTSIKNLNYPQEFIELKVIDGEGTVPEKVKQGVAETKGEYIVYASNDVEFTQDSLILAILEEKGLVAFNTEQPNLDEDNCCEHFIIKRSLISKLGGEIFCTRIKHYGCDSLLWKKSKILDEAIICSKAVVHHFHFSKGAEMDDVYRKALSTIEEDRLIYQEELEKLN